SASWADLASYRRLEHAGRLTIRVAVYLPVDAWRAVAESVKAHGAGDAWVKIGGLKGFMDGSAGSRTALFFEPYADSGAYRGLMQNPEQDMRSWIGNADSAGLQVAVHAYTTGNAFATSDEQKRGALAPGHYADVVVVDRNLFAMPAESLATARVRVTIVGGKVVYEKR